MIAALYVQKNGAYYGIDGVDPWDEERDARLYDGPWPVVAHPPCNHWSLLAFINQAKGHIKVGDDGNCFEAALNTVRTHGGVLEHPANTAAWKAFELLKPVATGGWSKSLYDDGWVCQVHQGHYGSLFDKPTWLYAINCDLPELTWGKCKTASFRISSLNTTGDYIRAGSKVDKLNKRGGRKAAATPEPFKQILIDMARSVKQQPNLRVA